MAMDFNPQSGAQGGVELMVNGTLAKTVITGMEIKHGKETGGRYVRVELTVADGPYRGRKLWPMLCDADDMKNSEGWRKQAVGSFCRILEALGIFRADVPQTYRAMGFEDCLRAITMTMQQNANLFIAIEVGVEKGKDGHQDRNGVRQYLSPNPGSDSNKKWLQLVSGGAQAVAGARTGALSGMMGGGGQRAPFVPGTSGAGAGGIAPAPSAAPSPGFGATTPSWLGQPASGAQTAQTAQRDPSIPL